jgi:hypothetical protein
MAHPCGPSPQTPPRISRLLDGQTEQWDFTVENAQHHDLQRYFGQVLSSSEALGNLFYGVF